MATFTGADKAIGFLFDMVANIADDYDSSSTYTEGDYAIYSGTLYKCTTTIVTSEAFTPSHWQAVLIMDEVAAGGGGGGGTTVIANPAGAATDTLNKLQVASTIYSIPSGGGGGGDLATYHGDWTASQVTTLNGAVTQAVQVPAGKFIVILHTPIVNTSGDTTIGTFGLLIGGNVSTSHLGQAFKQYGHLTFYVETSSNTTIGACWAMNVTATWNSSYLARGGIDIVQVA